MKKTRTLFRLIIGGLLVTGWGLAASSLHVIRTNGAPILIPKDHVGLADTYVDLRNWSAGDLPNHPGVVKRLVETGKADALASAVGGATGAELAAKVSEAMSHPATTQPSDVVTKATEKVREVAQRAKTSIDH